MASTQNAINNLLATTALTGTLQATQFPALTGDVTTVAGALAATISNNAITTVKINNSAITYAKIQNASANTLLGNPTGGSAAVSEITLGTNLSFSGSVLNVTDIFEPMPTIVVSATTQTMVTNTAYVSNNAGIVTMTLPATAVLGDELRVMGLGAGGWSIAQNAGQLIRFGNTVTTTGVSGSIASQNQWDTIHIKCIITNTTFTVVASQGNMTVA